MATKEEVPVRLDKVQFDQSERAEAVLEHILQTELSDSPKEDGKYVSVEDSMRRRPVIDIDSGRTKSRVLFITTNQAVLEKGTSAAGVYQDLSEWFDEVHVMVLISHEGKNETKRVASNVWHYKTHAKHWWQLPWKAVEVAYGELMFNQIARPDVVVAIDPFEASLAAYFIARDFARPWQIHIKTDFTLRAFIDGNKENKWRKRMADYVLKRVGSVRVTTDLVKQYIEKKHSSVGDLRLLPQFYNFAGLQSSTPAKDVHESYEQFSFVMATFGPLTADSHLHDTFSALRTQLLNKRIGLLVIGTGPAKHVFVEKAEILGISESVVFLENNADLLSVFKTADLLIQTDISEAGERVVLQAAAAGLPVAAYVTELRKDLFKHAESASLSEPGDVHALSQNITQLMNSQAMRLEYKRNSQEIARVRLHEDPETYHRSFRDTIEIILVPPEEEADEAEQQEQDETNTTDTNS